MKILEIGPSETRSRGGMAEVIRGIRESEVLGGTFEIDSFPSYIDGSLPVRLLYSLYGYLRFLTCSISTRRSGAAPSARIFTCGR